MRTSSLLNVKVPASKLGSIVEPAFAGTAFRRRVPCPPRTCDIGRIVISCPAVASATHGSMTIGTSPASLTVIARLPLPSAAPSDIVRVTVLRAPPSPESENTTTPSGL